MFECKWQIKFNYLLQKQEIETTSYQEQSWWET